MEKNRKARLILLVVFFSLMVSAPCFSQNVGINATGTSPNSSAGLDVDFSSKGVLIPRVSLSSTTDVSTIPGPVTSLLVYNSNGAMTGGTGVGFYYYNGSVWTPVLSGSAVTSVTGTTPVVVTNTSSTPAVSLQGDLGSVFYGTGGGSAALSAGSSGKMLTSNGAAAPSWANNSTLVTNVTVAEDVAANDAIAYANFGGGFSDNFDRGTTTTVGNGWSENNATTSDEEIVSNELRIGSFGPQVWDGAWKAHGTLVLPATLSMKIIPGSGNTRAMYNGIWGVQNQNNGIGLRWQVNSGGTNTYITSSGNLSASAAFAWDFSSLTYLWIDYLPNGSNVDVKVYLSATNTKPGSPNMTLLNQPIPTGGDAYFAGDALPSGSYIDFDDYSITSSGTIGHGIYKTDASTSEKSNYFIGFASASASAGSNVDVVVGGVKSGFTGLTAGAYYYLTNTSGVISTTAGTNVRKVGIAISSTDLLITNIW